MKSRVGTFAGWSIAAAVVAFLAPTAAAQDVDTTSWTGVQALRPGVSIDVRGASRRDGIAGKLADVTPESIRVERRGDQRTFQRDEVRRVQVVNEHRTRWLVLGVAASVGAGLAVGMATLGSTRYCDPFGSCTGRFPTEPGVGGRLLLTGVTTGTMASFLWLARNKTVYEK